MRILKVLALLLISSWASSEIKIAPKFIYVLHGGVDAIWGQYMFMVQNDGNEALSSEFEVAIPEQTLDWQAQRGLEGIQFSLGDKGGLVFKKEFKPGENLHMIGFKTPAEGGVAEISLVAPIDLSELSFLTQGGLSIEGGGVSKGVKDSGDRYDKYIVQDVKKGDTVAIKVRGVHVGRSQFWIYGWVVGIVLLLGSFGIAFKTRPQNTQEVV